MGGIGANRLKEAKKRLLRLNSSGRPKGRNQFRMDEGAIIIQLEELAKKFGVQIRYEDIKQDENLTFVVGGLCLFKGEYVLIINPKASVRDKIRTLAVALKHFDLDQIFIRPVIREILDRTPEQEPFGKDSSSNNQQVM